MNTVELGIPDLKLIIPKRFSDVRGYFSETWSDCQFRDEIGRRGLLYKTMNPRRHGKERCGDAASVRNLFEEVRSIS